MANEVLVAAVKNIIGLAKSGKTDEANDGYRALFSSPEFGAYTPTEQRQALNLMINKKVAPHMPKPSLVEAHRAAIGPLTELVSKYNEPMDYELLGICHVVVGNEAAAGNIFKTGLDLERAKDPGSNLCGALMKWVSSV
jgi:hypothetical protein